MKIVVAGGTGFIGNALMRRLNEAQYETVLLTRNPDRKDSAPFGSAPAGRSFGRHRAVGAAKAVAWDARSKGAWASELNGAQAVINLTGESIAGKRWTKTQKDRIVLSRVDSTRALVDAMKNLSARPRVFVSSSAVGYYGNVDEGDVSESHPKGKGFLADTCERWENEAQNAEALGIRTVLLRTGIVLEKGGGALGKMLPPFQFFAGGPIGSGAQWFPWIHRADAVDIILFAIKTESLKGPVNMTAPAPLRMKDFSAELGKAIHRPSWAPVPVLALKMLFGEMADMLLEGQKAVPKKLLAAGYAFRYPELGRALQSIFAGE